MVNWTDDLLLRLDFRDPEPEVVDISPEGGVVSTLKESKVECLSAQKVRFRNLFSVWGLIYCSRTFTCIISFCDILVDHWYFCHL